MWQGQLEVHLKRKNYQCMRISFIIAVLFVSICGAARRGIVRVKPRVDHGPAGADAGHAEGHRANGEPK
jgi:hypothetical protein